MKSTSTRQRIWVVLATLISLGLVYWFDESLRKNVNDAVAIMTLPDPPAAIAAFKEYLLGFGPWAAVVSAALMVFQSVAAPLPAFVVTFTNGLLFGWAWGALLSWSSAMAGSVLCYWIAQSLGRPVVEKLVGGGKALETWDIFFARFGVRAILVSRLLPFVSFDVISYGAGLTSIGLWDFVWATGLGQLPATLLYSYLGQNLTGSIKVLFWVFSITITVFVVGSAIGPYLLRKMRASNAHKSAAVPSATSDVRAS
ncbi:TVP38/TMEM64 family protein [Rhodoferax sp.]|uniref:TVP38/TMEM64 family protein n=1 Tax=Rhodoferax sp. TaxID=50421 RepID=UPI002632754C|nr:TVP38/TMEM64 family protein [Rhodoferax sp.]MDD2926969.1 TVP38/TMEM64 family protein [Rhodoferax sp.]